jgi:hypothetical protein
MNRGQGSWNYRVMRHIEAGGRAWLALHEVRYDDAGNPKTWSEEEASPGGETPEEIRADLKHMLAALDLPVLDFDGE